MNIGHSDRLSYDSQAYADKLNESVSPGTYRLDINHQYNCNGCLSTLGPRGSDGVSTLYSHTETPSQKLVDFESIMSNRNVKASKEKSGKVNPIGLKDFKLKHHDVCNNYLDPMHSRLTYPAINYRGVPINRFYNLLNDPQEHIFYDFAVNTTLEAKDNWDPEIPTPMKQDKYPKTLHGRGKRCGIKCKDGK